MKIKLDYDRLEAYAKNKGVTKLSELCRRAGVNYHAVLNNRYHKSGISIEIAWGLSQFLGCTINDIVKPDESGD
jgi:transcriptional regulator with XRE-family HTH domain